ncbi:MAG: methylenetetrahydrofolate reductase [NAD(P)H] [Pseudomonadota bacterium]
MEGNATGPAPALSFEFFPPKTPAGMSKLMETAARLAELKPVYFSVTFGAGGSTRERTLETVLALMRETGVDVAPHLSCIGATEDTLRDILRRYQDAGIRRLVALRGDLPSGMGDSGPFRYARDLVRFIRAETGDHFHIEVAAYPEIHPQARSAREDLGHFRDKIAAGADGAITQYFFNADAYARFVGETAAMGVDLPITPGIMPITSHAQLIRFSDACGAEVPRWIRQRLESLEADDAALREFGGDVVSVLCGQLLAIGVPGLHFYTLNQADPTLTICNRMRATSSATSNSTFALTAPIIR